MNYLQESYDIIQGNP